VVWAHNSHLGDARATEMSARGELNLFHESQVERFVLPLHDGRVRDVLMTPRLERAIGVIYRPQAERLSHYFQARLPDHSTRLFISTSPPRSYRWNDGHASSPTCRKRIRPEYERWHRRRHAPCQQRGDDAAKH
jgi:hypothetical protein